MSAGFHEAALNLAAHPLMWGVAGLARRVGPVWRVPGLGVLISDAEMAREILQRDEDFPKNGPGSFAGAMTLTLGPVALANMDGVEHQRLRAALAGVLTPARAEMLVRRRDGELQSLRASLARGDSVDLSQFMYGLSGRITFDLAGVAPPAGREREASLDLARLSARLASVLGFSEPSDKQIRRAQADCARLASYFREAYEAPAPPSSLIDRLQALGFGFDEATGVLMIFVIGGVLTVSAALPRIVALLIDNELLHRLAADPSGIPRAIDEGLRYITPLPGTIRIVRRDAVVRGHRLRAGARLIILTRNLARDPKLFPDPDRFDIARVQDPRAKRLWYGAGPHHCAGLNLAQIELQAVLGILAGFGDSLRIVRRRPGFGDLLPAYKQLVVRAGGDGG